MPPKQHEVIMGILDRINTLVRSNINDLTQRSDVPERELDRSMGDMKKSVVEARAHLRECERNEAQLVRQARKVRAEADEWEDKAYYALKRGEEELARECLIRKREIEKRGERLHEDLQRQRDYVADLQRSLDALELKLDAVKSRRNSISEHARGTRKEASERRSGRSSGFVFPDEGDDEPRGTTPPPRRRERSDDRRSTPSRRAFVFDDDLRREYPEDVFDAGKPFRAFGDMEDRIEQLESRVKAGAELDGYEDPLRDDLEERFQRLTRDRDLKDLRSRVSSDPSPRRESSRKSSGGETLADLRKQFEDDLGD